MFSGCYTSGENKVCFREYCFSVEVADTQEKIQTGLMYRQDLDQDQGMLFILTKDKIHPFWMKNVRFPLDIIWLDSNRKIVYLSENNPPCITGPCPVISPDKKSSYVLELKSGTIKKFGLKKGDRLKFYLDENR